MELRIAAAALAAFLSPLHAYDYPEAKRGEVVDDYHGTKVADPYRWLEDLDSPQTRAWVAAENALSAPLLAALPARPAYQQRLTELWNYARLELPFRKAGKLFYRKNDGLQDQSVLYVQDAADAEPRVLLDPNRLSADGTVALTTVAVSPDGRWLGYGLAAAGSDWNRFHVRDIGSGKDRDEVLEWVKFSGLAWTEDSAGFFYSRYPQPPTGAEAGTFDDLANQRLYYHRLSTPQSEDVLVYERPDNPKLGTGAVVSDDGRYLILSVWQGTSQNLLYAKDLGDPQHPKLDGPVIPLVETFAADYVPLGGIGPRLYLRTNADAPRQRIVEIDLSTPERPRWKTLIAEGEDTIETALLAGGEIITLTMHDAAHRLQRYTMAGKPIGEIPLPGLGSVPQTGDDYNLSGTPDSKTLYYGYASFNRPTTQYRYDLNKNRGELLFAPELKFKPDDYVTEQVFYSSRDGTRVPMFISYKKGLKKTGKNPTLLYGYGGFDISKTPSFAVPVLAWMERGGVYAVANLRGGGEYGAAWHEAGTLKNKQNVFDDFIAAAGYLIHNGWTAPEHLAINGRSNGGLLIGAVVNQRPDLFGAAVATVGVMDMLRFQKFTIGWAWVSDYGSSDDPAMFPYLYAYSPYHNIKPSTEYPAVLVTTADHDDRVVPGHSYKYTAAMQHAQAGADPILIRIDVEAGHGGGKPVSKQIEEWADILAFVTRYTQ